MIFYYSATGNSAWAARQIARLTGDTAVNMLTVRPEDQHFGAGDTLGLVFPVYAWAPPGFVLDFAAALNYKLGLVIINACRSDHQGNGRVLISDNGIFAGHSGILDPTGTNWWGDSSTIHVKDHLKPGDQGTKP